MFKISNSSTLP